MTTVARIIFFVLAILPVASQSLAARDVRVAVYDNPPLVAINGTEPVSGIIPDILRAVAVANDWHLIYQPGTWQQCLKRLTGNQVDIMVAIAYSEERARRFAFSSETVLANWGQIVARPDADYNSMLDLDGRHLAVLEKDIYLNALRRFDLNIRLGLFSSYAQVLTAVADGQADAGLVNRLYSHRFSSSSGLKETPIVFSPIEIRFAAPRQQGQVLLAALDAELRRLKDRPDSVYHQALARWLGGVKISRGLPAWLTWTVAALLTLLALLAGVSFFLRRMVLHQTRELRENERYARSLLDQLPENILVVNEQGVVLDVNRSLLQRIGKSAVEAMGADWVKMVTTAVPQLDGPEAIRLLERAFERDATVIHRHRHPGDGEPGNVHLDLLITPIVGATGHPRRAIVALHDMRDICAAQAALAQSEYKYRSLVESMGEGLTMVDADGLLTYVNPAFARMLGQTPETIIGRLLSCFMDEENQSVFHTHFEKRRQGDNSPYELTYRRADQAPVHTLVSPHALFDNRQRFAGAFAVITDITTQKRTECELAASREMYRGIVDNIELGISQLDTGYRIMEANRKMREWFPHLQVGGHHLCYQSFSDPPRSQPCPGCPVRQAIDSGKVQYGEMELKRDGQTVQYRIIASPFTDDQGRVAGVIKIYEDITERAALAEQLRQAQKMEAIGQLAGGVAHDFNNMLAVIMGSAELCADQLGGGHGAAEFVAQIRNAGQRAGDLVQQLLAFSRRQVLQPKDLDMNQHLGTMMKMLRRVVRENIELHFVPGHRLGVVYVDPVQIDQVVMNLCVNAQDAMPDGGRINIETENVMLDDVYCRQHTWAQPGRFVLLTITDSGCGMSEVVRSRIFEPFFTTKPKEKGTGLGLATVYGIVKQHDGIVNVYSEEGKGTIFKIYLPEVQRKASDVGQKVNGLVAGGTETILVAEDDEMVARIVTVILTTAGYEVLAAADGQQALALLDTKSDQIDLALLDVVMPKLNGHAVYKVIKKTYPHIRVLFSSGYTANAIHTDFILDEGLHLIQKPYARDELLRAVRELLDGQPLK